MSEVKISPKKIPIDDWVKAVKKLDGVGLKDDEKKVFDQVKIHKNIPKTPTRFTNFCIHNLKVKDEKVIKRIWGHLSVALGEQRTPAKDTKDSKKSKLDQKLKPKKNESGVKDSVEAKKQNAKKNDKVSEERATVNAKQENKKKANLNKNGSPAETKAVKKANVPVKSSPEEKNNKKNAKKIVKQADNGVKETKSAKKLKLEQKLKPKKNDKEANNGVTNNAKQDIKKKVSFTKTKSPDATKGLKKAETKVHKQTPKKVIEAKNSKQDPKKKGKKTEVVAEDSDEFSDDSEMSFDSNEELSVDEDDEGSDEEISDSDVSGSDEEELDGEEFSFDESDDDDDDDE